MGRGKMRVSETPGTYNIVYLEGSDKDGNPIENLPDEWNDRRLLVTMLEGIGWVVSCNHEATTEPGRYYTNRPMKKSGAARVALGQHLAVWGFGMHANLHRALVQVQPIKVHRDANRDFVRDGDNTQVGIFGINQHTTQTKGSGPLVGKWSAGCLVGRHYHEHLEFMRHLYGDLRYRADTKGFKFDTAIIKAIDL